VKIMAEFTYRGKTMDELTKMSIREFSGVVTARARRSLTRNKTEAERIARDKIGRKNNVKTHYRDLVIIPTMVGKTVKVYSGKEFVPVTIQEYMLGHFLGEFVLTRKKVGHNAPGIGATKSSSSISVR
jgi:small subunit ribosomal protein S19